MTNALAFIYGPDGVAYARVFTREDLIPHSVPEGHSWLRGKPGGPEHHSGAPHRSTMKRHRVHATTREILFI